MPPHSEIELHAFEHNGGCDVEWRIANNIRVIPSPNNGAFQVINYTNQPISSYALRDLTGRLILEKGNINNSIFYVQTQLLPGMYILNVTTENTIRSVRFSVD